MCKITYLLLFLIVLTASLFLDKCDGGNGLSPLNNIQFDLQQIEPNASVCLYFFCAFVSFCISYMAEVHETIAKILFAVFIVIVTSIFHIKIITENTY